MTTSAQNSLRQPTSYKRDLEREQGLRQHFQRRVEALELERDALKFRLQRAEAQLRQVQSVASPVRQGKLAGVGA